MNHASIIVIESIKIISFSISFCRPFRDLFLWRDFGGDLNALLKIPGCYVLIPKTVPYQGRFVVNLDAAASVSWYGTCDRMVKSALQE